MYGGGFHTDFDSIRVDQRLRMSRAGGRRHGEVWGWGYIYKAHQLRRSFPHSKPPVPLRLHSGIQHELISPQHLPSIYPGAATRSATSPHLCLSSSSLFLISSSLFLFLSPPLSPLPSSPSPCPSPSPPLSPPLPPPPPPSPSPSLSPLYSHWEIHDPHKPRVSHSPRPVRLTQCNLEITR